MARSSAKKRKSTPVDSFQFVYFLDAFGNDQHKEVLHGSLTDKLFFSIDYNGINLMMIINGFALSLTVVIKSS